MRRTELRFAPTPTPKKEQPLFAFFLLNTSVELGVVVLIRRGWRTEVHRLDRRRLRLANRAPSGILKETRFRLLTCDVS